MIALAAISMAALSCVPEDVPENGQEGGDDAIVSSLVEISVTAEISSDFAAGLWTAKDEISILGEKSGNRKFTAKSSGNPADFTGVADPSDQIMYAVYPYDSAVTVAKGTEKQKGAELMKVSIPAVQYAAKGSCDPKALTAIAKSADSEFKFQVIGNFIKFRLDNASDVKSVTISGNGGTILAGAAGAGFDKEGKIIPELSGTFSESSETIKLVEAEDGDRFENDTDYYVVTRARSCPEGITIHIEYDNGEVLTRTTTGNLFISEGLNQIASLGILNPADAQYLDFSYAGYMHGETSPSYNGYTIYNVADYKTDGRTDREAFLAALDAAFGTAGKKDELDEQNGNWWITYNHAPSAKVEIYFPEGDWVLHSSDDDETRNGKTYSKSIVIRAGDFVIKGAGREKTRIIMDAPMQPRDENLLYSSPEMIQIKHNSGLSGGIAVCGNLAAKGTFSVEVESAGNLAEGDWVCLYIKNNEEEFVNKEVAPYTPESNWLIKTNGVEVYDYHQIKSINGNIVTFHEPLMHEVDPKWGWEIKTYNHYQNVGIEDLTFVGKAETDFKHHQDWNHDGGYKPLSMNRLVNSWIRRVDFVSTSEACTILNSANVSAYDIRMSGDRGHAAIRSQASSRVLIAGTVDKTSDGAGNWHAVGVSKHSIGTVLLRNIWGNDSCFESHANQPRATLIDCCEGGWMTGHMGGNANEAPHHLADLTIWNFKATSGNAGEFLWWNEARTDWRFLKPLIYGFQSEGITFPAEQVIIDMQHGMQTEPESLYENQLRFRLGVLPEWINEINTNN